jgi:hypothetical protein
LIFSEVLPLVNTVEEAILLALLIYRGVAHRLPVFCTYLAWNFCSSALITPLFHVLSAEGYLRLYMAEYTLDALFELAVLVELGWVALRYSRVRAPRRLALLLLLVLATLLVWSLAKWTAPQNVSQVYQFFVHQQQAVAIFRVAVLLAIAWWSWLQDLHWPEEALLVAAGIGFYSIVELGVSIAHTRQSYGVSYQLLDDVMLFSYLGTLTYWVLMFAKKEEK